MKKKAEEMKKSEEAAEMKKEAASGAVSPRTAARKSEADAQVARALEAEEMVVSSLEHALKAAVGEVRRRQSIDAQTRPTRRPIASSLRSTTLDGSSWSLALAAQRKSTETPRRARTSLDCGRRQSLDFRANFERVAAQRLMGA